MRPADVTCVGEVLVDFLSSAPTRSLEVAPGFVKAAGGAPANVAAGLARLGMRTAFVGAVGNDSFGRFLTNELRRYGVDTRGMVPVDRWKTRLAFVAVAKDGERDFEFWEQDAADRHLTLKDVNIERVAGSGVVNIGSFLLLSEPSRSTVLAVAREVRRHGRLVCFDPNLRLSLWPSRAEARRVVRMMIGLADILRLNAVEATFFTKTRSIPAAMAQLLRQGPRLVVVTDGPKGCHFASRSVKGHVPGFRVKAVDTTGCGDGFLAGLLAGVVRASTAIGQSSAAELAAVCRFANAVGALVATKPGGIPAMPSKREVQEFLRKRS